jgi:RNase H-like domain found in reverse transcriptase
LWKVLPTLVPVDFTQPSRVKSDVSDYTTGTVLSMLCEDGKWHPCAFLSKGLNDVERNYDVHDKEMLGIIQVLEAWRHYLEGAKHELEIWNGSCEPLVLHVHQEVKLLPSMLGIIFIML